MGLNPYQKRSLEVRMRLLERTLRLVRRDMREPEDSILTRYRPLPETTRLRVEALIDKMLAEIAVLAERFELEPQEEDLRNYIDAEMGGEWSDLYDLLSSRLKGYGAVDPALAETLDPHVRRLIGLTYRASQVAKE